MTYYAFLAKKKNIKKKIINKTFICVTHATHVTLTHNVLTPTDLKAFIKVVEEFRWGH